MNTQVATLYLHSFKYCHVYYTHHTLCCTVIGQKVNMAARLMMMFPNTITCDETTKTKSNINLSQFSLAPPVKLKGISNPENIYTFSTERSVVKAEH